MRKVRIAILGAGTAGPTALSQVRKHTDDFVIVNHGAYGTTCARVGCMPSKALIQAADDFHRRHALDTLGIRGGEALRVDLPAVLQQVRATATPGAPQCWVPPRQQMGLRTQHVPGERLVVRRNPLLS